ncbi:MAG: hypothetical protein K2Q15_05080 [Burkholderiales bacterium]|nr:hypothetical protein [Burkholderiales bacterium]
MEPITSLALVGTANRSADIASLPDIDALLSLHSPEQKILLQAGALAVYRRAGWQAASMQLPTPAPLDEAKEIPAALAHVISDLLDKQYDEIRPWALARFSAQGWRLPYILLPHVLARADRAQWATLLGERGRWLQQLNPDWRINPPPEMDTLDAEQREQVWLEQSFPLRCAALKTQAECDLAVARQWLQAALPQEKAEQRLSLLQLWLAFYQHDADAPWFERLLSDRSQAVRQLVAGHLALDPQTPLAQRLLLRAALTLQWEKKPESGGIFSKIKSAMGHKAIPLLRIEPPQTLPKDWEKDGWIVNPPSGLGPRAWWLQQLVALIPPAHWAEQAQADISSVLAAMTNSEWADALLAGLCEASLRFADCAWAEALLHVLPEGLLREYRNRLWVMLPLEQRESLLIDYFQCANYPAALILFASLSISPALEQQLLAGMQKSFKVFRLMDYANANTSAQGISELLLLLQQFLLVSSDIVIDALCERIDDLAVLAGHDSWYYHQYAPKIARLAAQARLKQCLIKEVIL